MKDVILTSVILFSLNVFAGDKVGNGGGVWACGTSQGIQHAMLVDFYEAREEFGLSLITTSKMDPMAIVQDLRTTSRRALGEYGDRVDLLLTEAQEKLRFVNSELVIIDDSLFRIKPPASQCRWGWEYTQFANFTAQDQILIRSDLWYGNALRPLDKAGLIWHEVIYQWLRLDFKETNSINARQITGILFSTLPIEEMNFRIKKILKGVVPPPPPPPNMTWMCMTENTLDSKTFSGIGINQISAQANALINCQKGPNSFHCKESTRCEKFLQFDYIYACQMRNNLTGMVFSAEGRNLLEAEVLVRQQCEKEAPVHCGNLICMD